MAIVKHNPETNQWDVIVFAGDTMSFENEDEAEGFAEFVNGDEDR